MIKHKRKQKNDDSQSVFGCFSIGVRILAAILMLLFIGGIFLLFYAKTQHPAFEISVWVAILALFAYLCGYVALNQSKKKVHQDTIVPEITGLLHLIIRSLATMGIILFGGGVLLLIPIVLQYPQAHMLILLMVTIIITIVCAVIYFALRPNNRSDNIRDDFDSDKRKNDWYDNEDNA